VSERGYFEQRFHCVRCGVAVRVSSTYRIDPNLFVCSECLTPVDPSERQLSLSVEREERRDDFDPTIAAIPF
jgi:hypothetical protein